MKGKQIAVEVGVILINPVPAAMLFIIAWPVPLLISSNSRRRSDNNDEEKIYPVFLRSFVK